MLSSDDRWSDGDFLYIAMELCSSSLADYLREHCIKRDRSVALNFFGQIVDAIGFVHSKDMIHRDLKVNYKQ